MCGWHSGEGGGGRGEGLIEEKGWEELGTIKHQYLQPVNLVSSRFNWKQYCVYMYV